MDHNITSISYISARIPNDKPLKSITLPANTSYINFFAISLVSGTPSGSVDSPRLSVRNVRSTTKWVDAKDASSEKIQQIEVTLANLSPLSAPTNSSWLTSTHSLYLTSSNDEIKTVIPGKVIRLRSNDQVVIPISIQNNHKVEAGTKVQVTVHLRSEKNSTAVLLETEGQEFEIIAGIPEWNNSDESLRTHEAPDWVST